MEFPKSVRVSNKIHRKLKVRAAELDRPIYQVLDELLSQALNAQGEDAQDGTRQGRAIKE